MRKHRSPNSKCTKEPKHNSQKGTTNGEYLKLKFTSNQRYGKECTFLCTVGINVKLRKANLWSPTWSDVLRDIFKKLIKTRKTNMLFVKGKRWIHWYSLCSCPLSRFLNLKMTPWLIPLESKSIKSNEKECLLRNYLLCDSIYSLGEWCNK